MLKFDLEKAKAGHPLVDDSGIIHKLISHIPEARSDHRVVTVGDKGSVRLWTEDGKVWDADSAPKLFLAEKPKVKKSGWAYVSRWSFDAKLTKSKEEVESCMSEHGHANDDYVLIEFSGEVEE